MKTKVTISILSLLLAFNAIGEDLAHFRLGAKIKGKAEYARGKSEGKTQTRKIEAVITNLSDQKANSTVFKWTIYGHTMKDHKMVVIKEGDEKITIPANGEITVFSPEVKITGNRKYSVGSRSRGRGGKGRTKSKTVPAAGKDYYGYAVEVFSGGKLVASYYSQPSIEKDKHPEP